MVRNLFSFTCAVALLLGHHGVLALGTTSGTAVPNNVHVDFQLSGVAQPPLSDSVFLLVDNKVAPTVTVIGNTVSPGQSNQVLTFVITNNGNTTQGYALAVADSSVADNFNMNNVRIYIESGGVPGLDATDTLYTSGSGTNAGNVPANGTLTVYVVADVPPTGGSTAPADTNTARYDLLVTTLNTGTNTATASDSANAWNSAATQVVYADGSAGPSAADGSNDGRTSGTGTYSVNAPSVSLVKTIAISNPLGGTAPVTGATITYTLTVSITGTGTVNNLVVTDPVPANTTYVAGSLKLNAAALTDSADADAGNFNITNPDSITVNLGNLTSVAGNQVIRFSVTIN